MDEWQCRVFARIFSILADDAAISPKQTARLIYKMMLDEGVDPESIRKDECLIKLNLAERVYDASDDHMYTIYDE